MAEFTPLAAYFPKLLTEVMPIVMQLRRKKFYNIGHWSSVQDTSFSSLRTNAPNKL
jgi:hypothetical protein